MYEFTAESVQEKKRWEENIEKAMKGTSSKRERERERVIKYFLIVELLSPEPISPTLFENSNPVLLTPHMSNLALRGKTH